MKTTFVASVLALFLFGSLPTLDAEESTPVTLRSVFATKYLGFGHGFVLHDKPVIQTDLFIPITHGFYADLWNSRSLDGKLNDNLGNEVDYGAGWIGHVKGLEVEVGVSYYDMPNIFTFGSGDIIRSRLSVARPIFGWVLRGTVENYSTMPGSHFDGGNLFELGVGRSHTFWNRLTLNASTTIVYDDDYGFEAHLDSGFLQRASVELAWAVTKHLSLVAPQVNFYFPLSVHDERDTDAVVFAGFSYRF